MNEKDMAALLVELREAVAGSEGLSDDDRAHLDVLADRIEAEADESVLESIDDAITRFGVEHGTVARVVNRIANALSAGGV
ncbi:MAG: DUF4404 family protein [Acidimicrobiales bacterium]|nr:DUF4404 family protein [Acidimicrobiales bacterium]MDG1876619.1 DUF4404 family protein [Acidimicrobiales bacterium]